MNIKFESEELLDDGGWCDKRKEKRECYQCEFYNEIEDICEFKISNKRKEIKNMEVLNGGAR